MSQLAGVKPMSIAGRVASERERCVGMTASERAWRKQWLEDQILVDEPIPEKVAEYWAARTNIIRRIYRLPLDTVFGALEGTLGASRAKDYRYIAGKLGLIALGVLGIHYYFKYDKGNDWTKKGGWRYTRTKPMVLPGMKDFPFKSRKKARDYADRGFLAAKFGTAD